MPENSAARRRTPAVQGTRDAICEEPPCAILMAYPAPPASPPAPPPTFEELMLDATNGLVSYVELGVGAGLVVLFIICCCVCLRCIIRYRHRRKYPPAQRYATQASNASVASEGSVPPPVPSSRAWSAARSARHCRRLFISFRVVL